MSTVKQHRAKAAEFRAALDHAHSSIEIKEFRRLEQTYTTLADNDEWLARNVGKAVLSTV
jgi:hypothetical protein